MTSVLQRFRGLAIALAILAISAGAVFAAAPRFSPVSAPVAQEEETSEPTAEPTETPDEDTDTDEDTETPEATETPDATEAPAEDTTADNHGSMVSAAAQMDTPEGFRNHGEWVSCIAHMTDIVDPATITYDICFPPADPTATTTEKTHGKPDKAIEKSSAGKAKGQAAKAAHGHGHGHQTGG